ncbi:MAG: hypothetical protein AB1846_12795 [Chloroflexota bacterium]
MRIRKYLTRYHKIVKFVLTLFIAPFSITLIAEALLQLVKNEMVPFWQQAVTIISTLLFGILLFGGYTNLFDKIVIAIANKNRSRQFQKPKILVLDGRIEEGNEIAPEPAITNYLPPDWEQALLEPPFPLEVNVGPLVHS